MKWAIQWLAVFTLTTLFAAGISYLLDQWLNTAPLAILLCLAYAIGGGFYRLWKEMSKNE